MHAMINKEIHHNIGYMILLFFFKKKEIPVAFSAIDGGKQERSD